MAEAQVFVKIDEYKNVLRTIGVIKSRLNDAKSTLQRLKDLKRREDAEFEGWEGKLNEIEGRIDGIDRTLFEPGSL